MVISYLRFGETYWYLSGFSSPFFLRLQVSVGTAVAQWLRCCATSRKSAGSIPVGVVDIKSFRSQYGPGVDSASNRNDYQEHYLRVKVAGA